MVSVFAVNLTVIAITVMIHYEFLPTASEGEVLKVVMADPSDVVSLNELELALARPLDVTVSPPSLPRDNHAQPLPKRVIAALEKASLNPSKEPNASFMASAKLPSGSPPPFGLMICQKKEWFT